MNLMQHPELLDRLASSYALGTLRGGARRRFETLARDQAPVRAAALIWQSRLASLNELHGAVSGLSSSSSANASGAPPVSAKMLMFPLYTVGKISRI